MPVKKGKFVLFDIVFNLIETDLHQSNFPTAFDDVLGGSQDEIMQ
jgi:hypothetical protein